MKEPCKSQHKTYTCNESSDSGCPKFWPVADEEAQATSSHVAGTASKP